MLVVNCRIKDCLSELSISRDRLNIKYKREYVFRGKQG